MPKKEKNVIVKLLDCEEIKFSLDEVKSTSELLYAVCKHVGIEETQYFGLTYTHKKDGRLSWLDSKKILSNELKNATGMFKLAVQVYPQSVQQLKFPHTRYQFVLQLRENLLTGRWNCPTPTHALLASYLCQAEFGDYCAETHGIEYLNNVYFMPHQKVDFDEKVIAFHERHSGVTVEQADWLYLDGCSKLQTYGMQLFDVKDGDGNKLKMGVGADGVTLLQRHIQQLQYFSWPMINDVKFNGRELLIEIKLVVNLEHHVIQVEFKSRSALDAKRISKCSAVTRQHYLKDDAVFCKHVIQDHAPFKRISSQMFTKNTTPCCQFSTPRTNPEKSFDTATLNESIFGDGTSLLNEQQIDAQSLNASQVELQNDVPNTVTPIDSASPKSQTRHDSEGEVVTSPDDVTSPDPTNDVLSDAVIDDPEMLVIEMADVIIEDADVNTKEN